MHIADVTHFIRPGTALDDEAANRATTVYLTDKVFATLHGFISFIECSTQNRSLLSLGNCLGGESFQRSSTERKVLLLKNL